MSEEPTESEQSNKGEAVSPTRVGETARQLISRAKRASRRGQGYSAGHMPLKRHFSDMFWYIVIGLVVVLAIAVLVIYVPERDWPNKRWAWFSSFTILMFVFLTKSYWRVRKPKKFWAILFAIFVAHVVIYAPLLPYIQRAFWYLFIMPMEAMLIILVIHRLLRIMPTPKAED